MSPTGTYRRFAPTQQSCCFRAEADIGWIFAVAGRTLTRPPELRAKPTSGRRVPERRGDFLGSACFKWPPD